MPKLNRNIINYTWKQFFNDASLIAKAYQKSVDNKLIKNIYGIPRGGLILSVLLSHKLGIPLTDRNHISKGTLIVDDIIDTGKTLKVVIKGKKFFDITVLFRNVDNPPNDVAASWRRNARKNDWIVFPWEDNKIPKRDKTIK